ncbi:MAG: ABC transporter permease [Myxococcota bacterium]|nr:ABC transporter permease [Myxococcota bacterium]MDW8362614.1 ABC transporter permease [Myxococcales bacterium]
MRAEARWPRLVVAGYLTAALVGPALAPHDPHAIDLARQYEGPSLRHPLGTADNGVDVLSVLLHGARFGGTIAASTVVISLVLGAMLGTLAAMRGGLVEHAVMALADLVSAFPSLVLHVALLALVERPGPEHLVVALSASGWVVFARLARSRALELRNRDFVLASRALGASEARVLLRHVLPHLGGPLLVQASAAMGGAIVAEATLGFLGMGPATETSWGALLDQGTSVLLRFPHVALEVAAVLAVVVLAMHRTGDWLRDRLDPRTGR